MYDYDWPAPRIALLQRIVKFYCGHRYPEDGQGGLQFDVEPLLAELYLHIYLNRRYDRRLAEWINRTIPEENQNEFVNRWKAARRASRAARTGWAEREGQARVKRHLVGQHNKQ